MLKKSTLTVLLIISLYIYPAAGASLSLDYFHTFYIDPITLIISTALDYMPNMYKVTYEHALLDQLSLIVMPEIHDWDYRDENGTYTKQLFQIGGGLRYYLTDQDESDYLQCKLDIGHISASAPISAWDNTTSSWQTTVSSASGMTSRMMFYYGRKRMFDRICFCADAGIGYDFTPLELGDNNQWQLGGTTLAIDANFAIGFAF